MSTHKTFKINNRPSLTPEQLLVIKELFNGKRLQKELMMGTRNDKFSKHIIRPLVKKEIIRQYSNPTNKTQKFLELNYTPDAAVKILKDLPYIVILKGETIEGYRVFTEYKKTAVAKTTEKERRNIQKNFSYDIKGILREFFSSKYFNDKFTEAQKETIITSAMFSMDEIISIHSFYVNKLFEILNHFDWIFINEHCITHPKKLPKGLQELHNDLLLLRSSIVSTLISPTAAKRVKNIELIEGVTKRIGKRILSNKSNGNPSIEIQEIIEGLEDVIEISRVVHIFPGREDKVPKRTKVTKNVLYALSKIHLKEFDKF